MKTLPIISLALLLAGCGQNLAWKRLDGGSINDARLQAAQKECRIETKLAGIERAREARNDGLRKATTNEAEMRVKEDYDAIRQQVYREIDTCMNKQGYKR